MTTAFTIASLLAYLWSHALVLFVVGVALFLIVRHRDDWNDEA